MKYYTKEWYELMQHQHYTSGMNAIPDKHYSEQEIQAFYDADLTEEIERDRRIYDTPPDFSWSDRLLDPESFCPEHFLFEDKETGELLHPESIEMAKQYINEIQTENEETFAKRPPFDPKETIECFKDTYTSMLCYATAGYPEWVEKTVDKRLLALNRIPETAYNRLKKEETENKLAFDKIMKDATAVLEGQSIPEEIKSKFCFHDANLLALKRNRTDAELYLRKDGGWTSGTTPYIKIVFKGVSSVDREKGWVIRRKRDSDGELSSNCQYLYDELYKTEEGYEIHLLIWATKALRYLTICCEDIHFIDNINL